MYFFAWDKSPTSLVLIIKILSFCLFLRFFFTAYQMPYCQRRMIQKHPRSGKPHNLPDFLPHLRLVAMHLTVRTECFLFHKGTFLASESGIIRKFLTGRTHLSCRFVIFLMILPAVQPDHLFHDILFFLPLFFYFILFIHIVIRKFLPVLLSLPSRRSTGYGIPTPLRYRFFQPAHSSCR